VKRGKSVKHMDHLLFFQDKDNFIGTDLLNVIKNKCLRDFRSDLYWRINGKDGRVQFESRNTVFYGRYFPSIDRICVLTNYGIYLINPYTEGIEKKISDERHIFIGLARFNETALVAVGSPNAESSEGYIIAKVDTETGGYKSIDFPFLFRQMFVAKDIGFYVITDKHILILDKELNIRNKSALTFEPAKRECFELCGIWGDGSVITKVKNATKEYHVIKWGHISLNSSDLCSKVVLVSNYLWLLDDDLLKLVKKDGETFKEIRMKNKPISYGEINGQKIWFFYPNFTIDIYNNNGTFLESSIVLHKNWKSKIKRKI
jgi:hypothetical protein